MTQGIYSIRSEGEVLYVGQSVNIEKRSREHERKLKNNKHDNIHLQRISNLGRELVFGIIEEEVKDREDLTKREIYYIKKLNPKCNMDTPNENDSWERSLETKQKISNACRGVHYKRTPEDCEKISQRVKLWWASKGMTAESKRKTSKSIRELWKDPDYHKRLSDAHKGRPATAKQIQASKYNNHNRWHTKRNKWSNNCKFCRKERNA